MSDETHETEQPTRFVRFTRGKYVRSFREAEEIAASNPDVVRAMRGLLIDGRTEHPSPHVVTSRRVAAFVYVELVRRGYAAAFSTCQAWTARLGRATKATADSGRVIVDEILRDGPAAAVERGDMRVEPTREKTSAEWDRLACDWDGDDTEVQGVSKGGRLANNLRYWGMQNRAMRNKLERGECVDLSTCDRTIEGFYIVPPDVYQDDVDYCDAQTESWVWSVGRRLDNGAIHASLGSDLYQNDHYACLFLR